MAVVWLVREERERLKTELQGEALDRLEAEVALAAFDGTEVGAVETELNGEGFLADP